MPSSVLPFLFDAELQTIGGDSVEEVVPCSIWPAQSSRASDVGMMHDHVGEAALEHADALRVPNRKLVLGTDAGSLQGDYKILSATPMELVPHVVLELRRAGKV